MQNRGGSSPSSGRPHSISTSPYQPSPGAVVSPPHQSSPAPGAIPSSPQVEPGNGRNRLKKLMPNRPLPTQPYPHAQTSPAVMTTSTLEDRSSPPSQRYSIQSSPTGALPQRPPLSDYQVPITNGYSPRGGPPRPEYPSTPTKAPLHRPGNSMDYGGYGGYGADDSLALELSTIDIGPPRTGRTALRNSRGYGAY